MPFASATTPYGRVSPLDHDLDLDLDRSSHPAASRPDRRHARHRYHQPRRGTACGGAGRADARAILALYRLPPSRLPAAARPGLVLSVSADDMTGTAAMYRHVAESAGAEVAVLAGVSHWWMV